MKRLGCLTAIALLFASCADQSPQLPPGMKATATPQPQSRPAPPPPPPTPPAESGARAAALAAGPGTCADLKQIKVLPFKGDLGWDREYDRFIVHFPAYKDCLVTTILDSTPINDPGEGPKRYPYAVGDLAYDILTSAGAIDYRKCIPTEISGAYELRGVHAFIEWVHAGDNRQRLHLCVVKQLAPNNSFKPKPLRGSA